MLEKIDLPESWQKKSTEVVDVKQKLSNRGENL